MAAASEMMRKWLEKRYSAHTAADRKKEVERRLARFEQELESKGFGTEKERVEFAEKQIRIREAWDFLDSLGAAAEKLKPGQKSEAQRIADSLKEWAQELREKDPDTHRTIAMGINHLAVHLGSVVKGEQGKVRG